MEFSWSDGEAVVICVSAGSDTVRSGANIAPPINGKQDVLLYLIHVIPVLALQISSDAG